MKNSKLNSELEKLIVVLSPREYTLSRIPVIGSNYLKKLREKYQRELFQIGVYEDFELR